MPPRRSRSLLATIGVATVCVTATVASSAAAVEPQALADAVTLEGVTAHLQAFQDIADANGGNRAIGTAGYEASGAYIEEVLAESGYLTTRQEFDVSVTEILEYELAVPDVTVVGVPLSYSPDTPEGGLSLPLIQPVNPEGCDAAAWEGVDATGFIAVVQRGTCSFAAKDIAAGVAGAEAVVIYNNVEGPLNGTLGDAVLPEFIPGTGVTQEEGAAILAAYTADPEVVVDFVLTQEVVVTPTFNIIAETPTGRDDNTVMLGAHLDGVPEGAGINDNGTGSASLLETAVQLAEQGPLNNQVRFAWWGAEELGLLGSAYYVDDLAANDPAELDEIATYLNFDMVGSPNYIIGVYDADESTFPAPVEVPEGSIETEAVFTDYFDSIGQPWVDTEFSGRSDYDAFIRNGIPASGLFTGADGSKTAEEVELFGGEVGIPYDPNYHTPADDIDNVNPEGLGIMIKAIAFATGLLANDTSAINGVLPPAEPTPSPSPTPVPLPTPVPPTSDPGGELAATGTDAELALWASALVLTGLLGVWFAQARRRQEKGSRQV